MSRRRQFAVGQVWKAESDEGIKPYDGEYWAFQLLAEVVYEPSDHLWLGVKVGVVPTPSQVCLFDQTGRQRDEYGDDWSLRFRLTRRLRRKTGLYVRNDDLWTFTRGWC